MKTNPASDENEHPACAVNASEGVGRNTFEQHAAKKRSIFRRLLRLPSMIAADLQVVATHFSTPKCPNCKEREYVLYSARKGPICRKCGWEETT